MNHNGELNGNSYRNLIGDFIGFRKLALVLYFYDKEGNIQDYGQKLLRDVNENIIAKINDSDKVKVYDVDDFIHDIKYILSNQHENRRD